MRQKGFMLIELILFTIVGALFAAGALGIVKGITEYQRQTQTTDKTKLIAFALSKLSASEVPTNSTQFNDFLNRNFGSNLDPWSRPYRAVMATNVNNACNATSTDLAVQLPNGQVVQNVIALAFTPGNKAPNEENTLTLNGLNQNETFFRLSREANNPLRISVGDLYALKTLAEYQAEVCRGGSGGGSGCPNNTIINPPPGIITVSPGQSITICIDGEHRINGDLIIQRTGNSNSTGNYTGVKFIGKNGGTLRVNGSFLIQDYASSNQEYPPSSNETVVDISNLQLIVQGDEFRIDFQSVVFDNSLITINSSSIRIGWVNNTARVTFKNSSGTISGNNVVIGFSYSYGYPANTLVQFSNNSSITISGNNVSIGHAHLYYEGYTSNPSAQVQFSDNNSITISGNDVSIGYAYRKIAYYTSAYVVGGSAQFSNNGSVTINGGNINILSAQFSNSNITGSGILNMSNATLSNSQITNFAQINVNYRLSANSCLIRGDTIAVGEHPHYYYSYLETTSCRIEASAGNIRIGGASIDNSTFRVLAGREVYFHRTPTGTGNCFEKRLNTGGTTLNAPATTPWGQVLQNCP